MNNRNNNRRRGRGNRNQGNGPGQLNRIDSRARGNAPQLLDKYKKLAQDAQHNGDRVQMEYYLQFADHYFRVIADNKARQDEARAKRSDNRHDGRDQSNDDDDDGDARMESRNEGRSGNRGQKGRNRSRRDDAELADAEGEAGVEGDPADQEGDGNAPAPKPRRRRAAKADGDGAGESEADAPRTRKVRARKPAREAQDAGGGEIDSAVLPPAIGLGRGSDGDDTLEAVG